MSMSSAIKEVLMLDNKKTLTIYRAAVKRWGTASQVLMCVEECAELQKLLLHEMRFAKTIRPEDILEELADVQIMVEQMRVVFGFTTHEFMNKRAEKLRRLKLRTQEADSV